MLKPDFKKYRLALIRGDEIILLSNDQGLRPLVESLARYVNSKEKLILHDKVMGLAAARLLVYSGIISTVHTGTASQPARDFLRENGIELYAGEIVANILTKDQRAVCPGEVIALDTPEPGEFTKRIMAMLGKA